ncbi:MAG: hypothetical protein HOE78_11190, partial [Gammaproteobacteria bacterium]|nr:hypothetical protein [Gammaproteobacteria bacterium]
QAMTDIIDMPSIQIANTIHDFLPNIDKDVLVTTLDDYKKLDTWKSNISINTNSYENLLKVFLHSGYITKAHPMESCIV